MRVLLTIGLGVLAADSSIDAMKLRDLLADPAEWDAAVLPGPANPLRADAAAAPARPKVKPVSSVPAQFDLMPPELRDMAEKMGGVPEWWTGSGVSGEVQVPQGG